MDQWTVKWTYQCTPDDGRVAAETYVGWIEQKYENKKVHSLVKKLKITVTECFLSLTCWKVVDGVMHVTLVYVWCI
jgi:hypothetical protein